MVTYVIFLNQWSIKIKENKTTHTYDQLTQADSLVYFKICEIVWEKSTTKNLHVILKEIFNFYIFKYYYDS